MSLYEALLLILFISELDVNLVLPFITCKSFAGVLLRHPGPRHARIISLASQAAHVALENHVSYVRMSG